MSAEPLRAIDELNRDLKSAMALGLPMDRRLADASGPQDASLDDYRSALAVRVGLGQPLAEAIEQESRLSDRYRAAAAAWVREHRRDEVLTAVSPATESDPEFERSVRLFLLQLGVVLTVAIVGLWATFHWLFPKVEAIYRDLGLGLPDATGWLFGWQPAGGLLLIGVMLIWLLLGATRLGSAAVWSRHLVNRLPPFRLRQEAFRRARFADSLGGFLDHGVPRDQAIALAAGLSGTHPGGPSAAPVGRVGMPARQGETPARRGEATGAGERQRSVTSSGSTPDASDDLATTSGQLSPLIDWALRVDLGDESRGELLRSVAKIYRRRGNRPALQWLHRIPVLVSTMVCGLFVLAYGLVVFLPLVLLLDDLSRPGAGDWLGR